MVHNLDKVSRLKQYCGFKETARLLLAQFQDYAAIEKTYLAVCMQAVNQFLELPAIEQPDYRHLLDEMMSKALADELITKRVEELGGVPAVIYKNSDGSRAAVPCIQTRTPA